MPFATTAANGWPRLTRMGLAAALAATSLGMLSAEAFAVSKKVEKACTGDYLQFCPKYDEGTPQARSCMSQAGRRGQLSPRCLNALIDSGMVPRKYRR